MLGSQWEAAASWMPKQVVICCCNWKVSGGDPESREGESRGRSPAVVPGKRIAQPPTADMPPRPGTSPLASSALRDPRVEMQASKVCTHTVCAWGLLKSWRNYIRILTVTLGLQLIFIFKRLYFPVFLQTVFVISYFF